MLLSIVTSTYTDKRLNDLGDLLRSIENQTYKNIEIVLVIENSERMNEFATEYQTKLQKRIYFTKTRLGISKARNIGARLSSGEVVGFVDDDAILPVNWAERLVSNFNNHKGCIGVTGKVIPEWREMENPNFPRSLYWMIGCTAWHDSDKEYYSNFAIGVNMAYRREAFESHNFLENVEFAQADPNDRTSVKTSLPGDDTDFAVRLTTDTGRPMLYDPKLVVFHKVYPERLEWKFIRQYAFWQGFAEARYNSIHRLKGARSDAYDRLSSTLVRDLVDFSCGFRKTIWRSGVIVTALSFFLLGYASFRDGRILSFSRLFL